DNGAMNLAAGDTINFAYSYGATTTLAVGGTLTAPSADTFQAGSLSSNTTQLQVAAGGRLLPPHKNFNLSQLSLDNSSVLNSGDLTGNTFNLSFYVPYADVANLAGNAAFHDVDINGATLPSGGTLNLTALATNNANLRYVFYQGFTVA